MQGTAQHRAPAGAMQDAIATSVDAARLDKTVVLSENALTLPEPPSARRVRTVIMVPSAMQALLKAGRRPEGVRCVVVGGEVLKPSLAKQLHALARPPRVFNGPRGVRLARIGRAGIARQRHPGHLCAERPDRTLHLAGRAIG